jgi:hypothetical protein
VAKVRNPSMILPPPPPTVQGGTDCKTAEQAARPVRHFASHPDATSGPAPQRRTVHERTERRLDLIRAKLCGAEDSPRGPARPRRQFASSLRAGPGRYAWLRQKRCPPPAWNGSWNDAPDYPSAASAIRAMTCAIGAASALGARGRTSCKRQVIDSDPGGSQQARLAFFLVA